MDEPRVTTGHSRGAWFAVSLLTIAYVISLIDRLIINLLVEPIKAAFALSDLQVALIQGPAFAILYATAGVPLGWLADVVRRRTIAAVAISFWSLCTIATGMAGNFAMLLAARVGVGAGEAALTPTAYSMFADLFDRGRLGRAIAIYTAGGAIGSGIALLVGGVLYAHFSGSGSSLEPWRLTLIAVGVPGLLLAPLIAFALREPARRDDQGRVPFTLAFAAIGREWQFFAPVFAAYAALSCLIYGFFAWAPTHLIRAFGLDPAGAGLRFGLVMLITGTAGPLITGWIADRLAQRLGVVAPLRVMAGAFAIAGVAALTLLAVDAFGTTLAAFALLALAATGMLGLPPLAIQLAASSRTRGLLSGVNLMVGNLIGLGLGPVVVALVARGSDPATGLAPAIGWTVAVLAVAGVALCLVVRPTTGSADAR